MMVLPREVCDKIRAECEKRFPRDPNAKSVSVTISSSDFDIRKVSPEVLKMAQRYLSKKRLVD